MPQQQQPPRNQSMSDALAAINASFELSQTTDHENVLSKSIQWSQSSLLQDESTRITPSKRPTIKFLCKWENCNQMFSYRGQLMNHVRVLHIEPLESTLFEPQVPKLTTTIEMAPTEIDFDLIFDRTNPLNESLFQESINSDVTNLIYPTETQGKVVRPSSSLRKKQTQRSSSGSCILIMKHKPKHLRKGNSCKFEYKCTGCGQRLAWNSKLNNHKCHKRKNSKKDKKHGFKKWNTTQAHSTKNFKREFKEFSPFGNELITPKRIKLIITNEQLPQASTPIQSISLNDQLYSSRQPLYQFGLNGESLDGAFPDGRSLKQFNQNVQSLDELKAVVQSLDKVNIPEGQVSDGNVLCEQSIIQQDPTQHSFAQFGLNGNSLDGIVLDEKYLDDTNSVGQLSDITILDGLEPDEQSLKTVDQTKQKQKSSSLKCSHAGCKLTFKCQSTRHLARSHQSHHREQSHGLQRCPWNDCTEIFFNDTDLEKHLADSTFVVRTPFEQSTRSTRSRSSIKSANSLRESSISSPLCDNEYKTKFQLNSTTKQFDCGLCSKSFPKRVSIAQHLSIVHSAEQYTCKHCEGVFKSRQSFRNHFASRKHRNSASLRSNTGSENQSLESVVLNDHAQLEQSKEPNDSSSNADSKKPFKCNYKNCNKSYKFEKKLMTHCRKKHSEYSSDKAALEESNPEEPKDFASNEYLPKRIRFNCTLEDNDKSCQFGKLLMKHCQKLHLNGSSDKTSLETDVQEEESHDQISIRCDQTINQVLTNLSTDKVSSTDTSPTDQIFEVMQQKLQTKKQELQQMRYQLQQTQQRVFLGQQQLHRRKQL